MNGLAPYDAIMMVSYGGPNGPDDVLPFMRNATAGTGVPDERLLEVSGHYALFGGISPINARNAELRVALAAELTRRGIDIPIVIGNRNWHPFMADTLVDLADRGATRVLCLLMAAYASYSGCRQYHLNLAAARPNEAMVIDTVAPYAETDGFVSANARAVRHALAEWSVAPNERHRVVFVTHSIPVAVDVASGSGPASERYSAQHQRVAERIVAAVEAAGVTMPTWEIAYCSRSGAPHIPWLTPDLDDRLVELADEGVTAVITVPFGFTSDHMEVIYDLDTQAAATARDVGLRYLRAATVGTDPDFVTMLVDRMVERAAVARGEQAMPDELKKFCAPHCCGSGRPTARPQR